MVQNLKKYIDRPKLLEGGRILVFPLRGNFDLNYFSRGRRVIVEVIDPNPSVNEFTANANSSSNLNRRRNLERVSIRLGSHPTYSRIVFDWKKRIKYEVTKSKNLVTIKFERPASIILDNLNKKKLANVMGARSRVMNKATIVGLSVKSSATLKHFRSGSRVILDILNSKGADDAPPISKLMPQRNKNKNVDDKLSVIGKTKANTDTEVAQNNRPSPGLNKQIKTTNKGKKINT